MADAVLAARGLTRRFGGLVAVSDVSLPLHKGELHALIGTNGAGKSTLINLLSGELSPTSGVVLLDGAPLRRASPSRLARMGVGRTFQRSNVFMDFSVLENCRLAAQARLPRPWAIHERARGCTHSMEAASRALEQVDLAARGAVDALTLSHGERRQLEIAMCLAGNPRVLLLDEPLAGMGADESQRMVALLRKLKPDHAILLVEHDMDAVFSVADVITVMVNGAVLASGSPTEVRNNPAVREAYLADAI
jgi:branched-chain amino acid transport system ATP-binding protein